MRKSWIVFLLMAMFGITTVFGQLKVSNNYGQDLKITVNGVENLVQNKSIKNFDARGRLVWLTCQTINGKEKFTISKNVSRSGAVSVEPGDNSSAVAVQTYNSTTVVSPAPTTSSSTVTTYSSAASPLSAILNGSGQAPAQTNVTTVTEYKSTSTSNAAPVVVSAPVPVRTITQPQVVQGEKIAFVYDGTDRFKIFSEIGKGLEFRGADTTNVEEDNAKNRYIFNVPRNQDLILGIGIKIGENQAIWPYAEIRKRINSWDTLCFIAQKDIKKMSTSENRTLRIKPMAENYKIFFEPESGEPISLGFKETSRPIEVPIGQFYIRVSYTDAQGMFHRTVFVPKHVTLKDKYLEITKHDLDNAVQLNW